MTSVVLLGMFAIVNNGQSTPRCVFNDQVGSEHQLDLRALLASELTGRDHLTPPNSYAFTPCRNGIDCTSDMAMAVKLETIPDDTCFVMANWTTAQSTLPSYDNTFKRWTFNYSSGTQCGGKPYTFFAYFGCDKRISDYTVVSTGMISECAAAMFIETQWACIGHMYTTAPPVDDSWSTGTVVVVIFFVGFLLYFVIGYIICGILNKKDHGFCDVTANIPHFIFWSHLPALVMAGCGFTKDFVSALFYDASDKSENLVNDRINI